ncbi:putative leucine-rich repeat domain, L domain-containing protein [Medicago truncatula]|uniref:F-box/RNI superfamily protein n=1 Tax=Medicago truncatula TaxID=3880 RepID=A0A072VCV0_MEDTR|nr:F-box/RNI superfamily protein [Medicago truncatula]RHN76592.1 putative leucine-rich repeat domain, L domain-containing protein [Medicago truncatula]
MIFIGIPHLLLIADCFPDLQVLDLNNLYGITGEGMCHVLRRCCNIRHLNLVCCSRLELRGINFEVPKLEVLNLSETMVDDETLHVISKSCRGLLQLLLKKCYHVTDKGVKHVVENCTQLTEINLRHCFQVHANVIVSMVFSRPSLKKINVPVLYHISQQERELLSRQGCLVC